MAIDKKDLKIVFFGTPEFAVSPLDRLVSAGYNIEAVVTATDKPGGRGHHLIESDVKKYAVSHGLPLLQPAKLRDPEFIDTLRRIDADLFIVIAFRMLPEQVWAMPRLGTFNLHASLLPAYRGAAPINRAIINGEKRTGVTTFFLKHEIDTGDIISQKAIEIGEDENVGSLYDRLMRLGAEMTLHTVEQICAGTLQTHPQPEGEFVPAPKIFAEDCQIDWNQPTRTIHNLVRGLSPYPASRTLIRLEGGKELNAKIFETRILDESLFSIYQGLAPGEVADSRKHLIVGTADGAIEITGLQPGGGKRMTGAAYLVGNRPVSLS